MRRVLILATAVLALGLGGAAQAQVLSACIWGKLTGADQTKVLAAYRRDMPAGAGALEKLDGKLRAAMAACAGRRDVPATWAQTLAGSEAVQASMAEMLLAKGVTRARLDAAWKAAPPTVAACVRANGRLAFSPNAVGCSDQATTNWILRQAASAPGQPAARQAVYFFNAKAIGEWGDKLVGGLKR